MPIKFIGQLQELKDRLLPLDLDGDWQPQPNGVWKFRCRDRAGLLWAGTTGRVWFDGPDMPKAALEGKVATVLADGMIVQPAAAGSQIFVVHGRDHEARDQLRLVLFSLRLEPFVLQVTGGGGDTLIEALERMIGKTAQSAFGIVLVTPDDMGYLQKEEKPEDAKPRARKM
jgi:predicted nucleotide-binding protein